MPVDPTPHQVALWCLRRILTRALQEPVSQSLRWLSGSLKSSLQGLNLPFPKPGTKRRPFPSSVRDLCWQKAEPVPGRHPDRWRRDVAGNLVARELNGCEGALCYTYDHIVPISKGGECTLENCQVLQTRANFWKADRRSVSVQDLRRASSQLEVTDELLDSVELGIYGNAWSEGAESNPLFRLRKMPWPKRW